MICLDDLLQTVPAYRAAPVRLVLKFHCFRRLLILSVQCTWPVGRDSDHAPYVCPCQAKPLLPLLVHSCLSLIRTEPFFPSFLPLVFFVQRPHQQTLGKTLEDSEIERPRTLFHSNLLTRIFHLLLHSLLSPISYIRWVTLEQSASFPVEFKSFRLGRQVCPVCLELSSWSSQSHRHSN